MAKKRSAKRVSQKIEKVAAESNQSARYQTEGYKRSEDRKKLTRRINRLRNDISSGKIKGAANISSAEKLISSLEAAKKESYIDRKSGKYTYARERLKNVIDYASQTREEIQFDVSRYKPRETGELMTMRQYGEEIDAKTLYRRNVIFQNKLSQASASTDIGVSEITKAEAKVFYTLTQEFWQNADAKYRNQAIIEKLYEEGLIEHKSLEEAFDVLMQSELAKSALRMAENELENEIDTSPDYIDYVIANR